MKNSQKLVLSAFLIAIGMVLPFFTGQVPYVGNVLLPMHIPVFSCGLICGGQYGLAVGVVLPFLRSVVFGAPIMYPTAIAMAFELGTYGAISGFLFTKAKWQCIKSLYRCMITAMLGGRLVWGLVMVFILGIGAKGFTLQMFLAGAFINAIPGIILQLVLVPAVMLALHKTHLVPMRRGEHHEHHMA